MQQAHKNIELKKDLTKVKYYDRDDSGSSYDNQRRDQGTQNTRVDV